MAILSSPALTSVHYLHPQPDIFDVKLTKEIGRTFTGFGFDSGNMEASK
jgi:hypothetical protein